MWRHHTAMLTVILTRHGHTDRSEPDQYTGQSVQAHLTETGRVGALALGQRLAGIDLARVISSPLERAVDSARLIRPEADVEIDDRLMEADYGDWEGFTIDEVEARWPDLRARWEADPASVAFPNGECGMDVARRARSLLDDLVAWEASQGDPDADRCVLLVGHATLDRVLLAVALGVPLGDYRRRFRQDWVNLTVLRFTPGDDTGAQLLLANDLAHVHGISGATWD
jgi:broad specificity phosphatase PhoE